MSTLVDSFLDDAGNKDNPKSLNEFEFWQDPITDYCVSCSWTSGKIPIISSRELKIPFEGDITVRKNRENTNRNLNFLVVYY